MLSLFGLLGATYAVFLKFYMDAFQEILSGIVETNFHFSLEPTVWVTSVPHPPPPDFYNNPVSGLLS